MQAFLGGQKKKTRRWERRVRSFLVIGVYGFKYAAWLLLVRPRAQSGLLFFSADFLLVLLSSCSF
jgi:hypothetical protein